jgi:hypothetical protein
LLLQVALIAPLFHTRSNRHSNFPAKASGSEQTTTTISIITLFTTG